MIRRTVHFVACSMLLLLPLVVSAKNEPAPIGIPVPVSDDTRYLFELFSDSDYSDERGRRMIDVLEGYQVNLALSVDTLEGQPVIGLRPLFDLDGSSLVMPPGDAPALNSTDESGILEFSVTAGQKGLDRLTVSYGENTATVFLNIISLSIQDFPPVPSLDSGLNWSELMQADLQLVDGKLEVVFPPLIQQQAGESVQVSGFMMPLEAGMEQTHFLLTSSPPHCFFHIPGGPAGVIEVHAEKGIETSWAPIKLEGRLELLKNSDNGVIYQLKRAEIVD